MKAIINQTKKIYILLFFFLFVFGCRENSETVISYYNSGLIEEKYELKNGFRDGKIESYYENGKLQTKGFYHKGKEDGLWLNYYPNNLLSDSTLYDKGKVIFQFSFDTNRVITMQNGTGYRVLIYEISDNIGKISYENYIPDGQYIEWYPNGKIYCLGNYKMGIPFGEWKYYNDNGVLQKIETH